MVALVAAPSSIRAVDHPAKLDRLCHRVESLVGAPTLEQQPRKYLVAQAQRSCCAASVTCHAEATRLFRVSSVVIRRIATTASGGSSRSTLFADPRIRR